MNFHPQKHLNPGLVVSSSYSNSSLHGQRVDVYHLFDGPCQFVKCSCPGYVLHWNSYTHTKKKCHHSFYPLIVALNAVQDCSCHHLHFSSYEDKYHSPKII